MSKRKTKNPVMQALFRGASAKRPAKGLILHSDRGGYPSPAAFTQRSYENQLAA